MDDTAVMKGIRISTVVVRWRVIHYDLAYGLLYSSTTALNAMKWRQVVSHYDNTDCLTESDRLWRE